MLKRHIALISDVHGNLPALEAVLADIDKRGIPEIICLGDLVGYGPYPKEVVDLIMKRCSAVIMGNHDEALIHGPLAFSLRARQAIEWSQEQMRPSWLSSSNVRKRWRYLQELETFHRAGDCLFVHGSPRDYTSEYVLPKEFEWGSNTEKMTEIFSLIEHVCFNGHTHLPGVFSREHFYTPDEYQERGIELGQLDKAIVNVGSVGQPRDLDPRACYVEVLDEQAHFHRVEYDIASVVAAVEATGELHESLGKRLLRGM